MNNIKNRYNKFIIWGHKLHSHTHSYIHNAFYIASKHMGFDTYWFEDNDFDPNFDYNNSIFITEGQVDKNIPLLQSCFYVCHNCNDAKYIPFYEKNKCITLQVYTNDVLSRNLFKVENCIYYDVPGKCMYMPWATDLLPHEINNINHLLELNGNKIWWVGTVGGGEFGNVDEISPFKQICKENGIEFISTHGKSVSENVSLIKESYLAPTIVGNWQSRVGYVPCRIFKNISYGRMGITNSKIVHSLFNELTVHNSNTYELFSDSKNYIKEMPVDKMNYLIDFVRNSHTYVNRINTILTFIEKIIK
jgi:hypothetical protein